MPDDPAVFDAVPTSVWKLTVKRAKVLAPLAEEDHCSIEQIDEAARRLSIGRAMVYRLLSRYRQSLQTASLLPSKPGPKRGSKELKPAQEQIIDSLIHKFYLSKQKPSVAALHRTLAFECFQAGVQAPCYKAVKTRVASVATRDVVRARDGAQAARDRFQPLKRSLSITEPLELLQIDHTLVDVIVVDDVERKPIGRPWLSLAIDIATRTVPGFFLSLRAPSALSTAAVISRAVLSKEAFRAALQLEAEWPMQGIPRSLHLDNAKEFHAHALRRECEQYGIQIVYRPPCRPHFGGHIERLIGTLMGEVHLLPGTTFSSVAARGDYNSARQAMMTLQELETWLAWQIAGVYHLRTHSALRRSPLDAWKEGVQMMRKSPREPADPQRFYIDFLPFKKRAIGRAGIRISNILYWHGALGRYVSDGRKRVVKYDPSNMSYVYLLEPGGSYLEIPYRDLSNGPVSLSEIQVSSRALRVNEGSAVNEQKLFKSIQKQREVIETAKHKSLRARRRAQEILRAKPKALSAVPQQMHLILRPRSQSTRSRSRSGMIDSLDHLAPECRDEARLGPQERVRAILAERWINYPRAVFALQRLEHLLHHPPRDRMPCLLLFGATGMGKTKILRKFIRDHPALFNSRTGVKGVLLVSMQMPPEPDEMAFYLQLLDALNAPTRYNHTVYHLRQIVRDLLEFTQTRVIVIDEVHTLLASTYRQQRILLNTLRFLANELCLSLVCAGTADAKRALLTDQQLADRFEAVELPPWHNDIDFRRLLPAFKRSCL